MDISPEVLFGGIGIGFSGMALGMRVIYTHLKATFEARISALEAALSEAHKFERETLIGLLADSQARETEHSRADRRMTRVIIHLRKRFGDEILGEILDLTAGLSDEDSDIQPQDVSLIPPRTRPTPTSGTRPIPT